MTNDLKLDEGPVGLTSGPGVFMKEEDLWRTWGTGVSGLTRGLANIP